MHDSVPMIKKQGEKRKFCESNNDKMHACNVYKDKPPDFELLAKKYSTFATYVFTNKQGLPTIDWKNDDAVRELTKILLDSDFNIKIELPPSQLCPTVTSRANYLYWLKDLMELSSKKRKKTGNEEIVKELRVVRGIDIGTGGSCIYPLLGVSMYGWNFVATDIDSVSIEYAQKNIDLNGWNGKIELRLVKEGIIIKDMIKENESFNFCMCNPPFFDSLEQKIDNPRTTCKATDNELVTKGGELKFVSQIIEDSLILRDRIRWYTSMIGRKVNLKKLLKILQNRQVRNVRVTTFYQGYTTRWAIAWSFSDEGFEDTVRERMIQSVAGKRKACFSLCNHSLGEVMKMLESFLNSNDVAYRTDLSYSLITGNMYESSGWWRKRNEDNIEIASTEKGIGPMMPPQLIFSFEIQVFLITEREFTVQVTIKRGDDIKSFTEFFVDIKMHTQKLFE